MFLPIALYTVHQVEQPKGAFGMLAVDPGWRKAGVGLALVTGAEDHCRTGSCAGTGPFFRLWRSCMPAFGMAASVGVR